MSLITKRFSTECLIKILEEFGQHRLNSCLTTIYSCMLVNREWCKIAVSILWRDPMGWLNESFNFCDRIPLLISTYCISHAYRTNQKSPFFKKILLFPL